MKFEQEPISRQGFLSPWTFRDPGFFEREVAYFLGSWQLFGHRSEIPQKGELRRLWVASSVVSVFFDESGHLRCEFQLSGGGTRPGEIREIMGLVFVALELPELEISECFAPFLEELGRNRLEEVRPVSRSSEKIIPANWKILVEISLDETHVDSVHPQLKGVMAGAINYKTHHSLRRWDQPLLEPVFDFNPLVLYLKLRRFLFPKMKGLTHWTYFWNFPGMELEFYPEQFAYYQVVPLTPDSTLKRSLSLGVPSWNPFMSLLRRINHRLQERIDQQDIECVAKRQKVISSLVDFEMLGTNGDGLVKKFHETVEKAVRAPLK